MNKPQIIKNNGKPEFVVLDYQDYLTLIDYIEDKEGILRDLKEALEEKQAGVETEDFNSFMNSLK
jgi:PHD/YefM family antitoxin component YafN of YafNO toxin-antitoxin module